MTGPGKTGLIYAKYTLVHNMVPKHISCSEYAIHSISFIEFPIDICMHDKTCVIIQNTIKKLLQFQHSKIRSNFMCR